MEIVAAQIRTSTDGGIRHWSLRMISHYQVRRRSSAAPSWNQFSGAATTSLVDGDSLLHHPLCGG